MHATVNRQAGHAARGFESHRIRQALLYGLFFGPACLDSLPCALTALLPRHGCGPSQTALFSASFTEANSIRVFPLVRHKLIIRARAGKSRK